MFVTLSDRDTISGQSLTPTVTDFAVKNGDALNAGSSAMVSPSAESD